MVGPNAKIFVILVVGSINNPPLVGAQETKQSEREAMYHRYLEFPSHVKGGSITPHWMEDGSSFWYAEGLPANTLIWKVDPGANTRTPLFDTARLRQSLTPLIGREPPYQGLPFAEFTFLDGEKAVKFTVENKEFILHLDTYKIIRAPTLSGEQKIQLVPQAAEVPSPDGHWFAGIKDYNLWLRSTDNGRRVQLTSDGVKDYEWMVRGRSAAHWSPDGSKLAVTKVDYRKVPKIPIVHYLNPAEEVEWITWPRMAGKPKEQLELFIIDIASKRKVRVDAGGDPGQNISLLAWSSNSSELLFLRNPPYARDDLGVLKMELMAANAATGSTRIVLTHDEAFVLRQTPFTTLLEDGAGFIWLSQRSGWKHLYLYDMNGTLIRQLTKGEFPVVRVVSVDQKAGWIYFVAHGDRQRPYDTHLYRVNMEGQGFTRLTEAPGQHDLQIFGRFLHRVQFAPSKQFFLDTHSTTARPPAVELRRADGALLQTLSKANIDGLKDLKWSPPEEFVVKAADGSTDLYGVLYKPYDFDPNKKYPVIEHIYGGLSIVPRTFADISEREGGGVWSQAMAQLGFITLIVDGRGPFIGGARGREFESVTYGTWGRYEIPDHVATLKQLAEKRPYMDLTRVGIQGNSLGGYYAIRAMLQAPDVYHVGIGVAPITDLYEHPNHGQLGPPETNKEAYAYASNLLLAGNLRGKLLLMHGTSDVEVPFSHTMRMVDALNRAGKRYDLIVLPKWGHWVPGNMLEDYRLEAYRSYFQEHLKP
ncbi:MAG TPA: DPP IV N-terminal domain-containing protein [Gemmatimonadaceae bacterium]|nr:DPP IV N-terminal domain-containing protein [Gemmatimonadaceae bacterium]